MRRVFALALAAGCARGEVTLRERMEAIARDSKGTVSASCSLPGVALDCDLGSTAHAPMQSVFKLPLAVAVLHRVEEGKLRLEQTVRFEKADRILPKTHSPLQDEFPEAGVDVALSKLLRLSVAASDNAATDMLLRLAGGPAAVNGYIASLGVVGLHIEDGEHALHRDVSAQYRNWFEPAGAVRLLRILADRPPLNAEHTALLLTWMQGSMRSTRLGGELPAGTVVEHKSGSSGENEGLANATNDIGLITLPDGRKLAVAVFLTDSRADDGARDRTIARIARAVYDAAIHTVVK